MIGQIAVALREPQKLANMDDSGKWSFSSDSLMDLRSSLSSPNAMESPMLNDLDGKYFVCEF